MLVMLTKVCYANTAGKIEELLAITKGNIGALALRHDAFDDASDTLGDMLLAELDQRGIIAAS